jgi:hypothetical protein
LAEAKLNRGGAQATRSLAAGMRLRLLMLAINSSASLRIIAILFPSGSLMPVVNCAIVQNVTVTESNGGRYASFGLVLGSGTAT